MPRDAPPAPERGVAGGTDGADRASGERGSREQRVLVDLTRSEAIRSGSFEAALTAVARAGMDGLEVERVSVWHFRADGASIECVVMEDAAGPPGDVGFLLWVEEHPRYFHAISTADVVAVADAVADPRTAELAPGYLVPRRIGAMLDAPIYLAGHRWGILCHEQVGERRVWSEGQQLLAMALANLAAVAVAHSERRRTESELAASERHYRTLTEGALDAIVTTDSTRRIRFVNAAAERAFGRRREEVIGLDLETLVPGPVLRRHVAQLAGAAERGEPAVTGSIEVVGRRADGSDLPLDVVLTGSLRAEGAEVTGAFRDISDRLSHARYREALASIHAGIWRAGFTRPVPVALPVAEQVEWIFEHFYVAECNLAFARMHGLERPEQVVGPRRVARDPEREAEVTSLMRKFVEQGYRYEDEEREERIDTGETRLFLESVFGIVEDGLLVRAWGVKTDVTAAKQADRALRESEERLRQIAESSSDVIWLVDWKAMRLLYASKAYEEVFGRPVARLFESPDDWLESVHPEDRERVRLARNSAAGGGFDQTYRVLRDDGSVRWIHSRGFPIRDLDGEIYRFSGIAEDITALKQTEEALRASERRLAAALQQSEAQVVRLEEQIRDRHKLERLVGKSAAMQEVYRRVRLAAESDVTVLLTGESGTGKELAAAAIHELSGRHDRPFVAINCSAIPESLLESELFGHVKGAFTGATRDRAGMFETAQGGTLFLDEIGDLEPVLQVKLLRALQEREIRRVGDEHPIKIDVRIIAATHRDLREMVATGGMRQDFYYRIHVFPLALPALRDRRGDIPLLVEHFLDELSRQRGRTAPGVGAEAMRRLLDNAWPGNVRELRNAIEHALVTVRESGEIELDDLPPEVRGDPVPRSAVAKRVAPAAPDERARIAAALERAGGNRARAARDLGVSRVTLWKWMRRLGIAGDAAAAGGDQPGPTVKRR